MLRPAVLNSSEQIFPTFVRVSCELGQLSHHRGKQLVRGKNDWVRPSLEENC